MSIFFIPRGAIAFVMICVYSPDCIPPVYLSIYVCKVTMMLYLNICTQRNTQCGLYLYVSAFFAVMLEAIASEVDQEAFYEAIELGYQEVGVMSYITLLRCCYLVFV